MLNPIFLYLTVLLKLKFVKLLLFFLQTIGIDSEFCLVESLVTGIVDMWPEKLR